MFLLLLHLQGRDKFCLLKVINYSLPHHTIHHISNLYLFVRVLVFYCGIIVLDLIAFCRVIKLKVCCCLEDILRVFKVISIDNVGLDKILEFLRMLNLCCVCSDYLYLRAVGFNQRRLFSRKLSYINTASPQVAAS